MAQRAHDIHKHEIDRNHRPHPASWHIRVWDRPIKRALLFKRARRSAGKKATRLAGESGESAGCPDISRARTLHPYLASSLYDGTSQARVE